MALLLVFLICFTPISFASIVDQNQRLLDDLMSPQGWEPVSIQKTEWTLTRKQIAKSNIQALSVTGITDAKPTQIVEALKSIDRYSQFLRAGKRLKAQKISNENDTIIGFQRWLVPIWNDRTLLFAMKTQDTPQSTLVSWTLLSPIHDTSYTLSNQLFQNSVRITHGAGYWECKPLPNGKTQVTHRVFMDAGGNFPSFLVNYINKTGLIEQVEDIVREAKRRR